MKRIRNLLLVGAMVVFYGSMANAQIIYSNAFDGGQVNLWGTAPNVANSAYGGTNTALWIECLGTNNTNGVLFANGTNTTPLPDSWILPFNPQSGHVYTLTAKINFSGAVGNWLAAGFCQNLVTNTVIGWGRFSDNGVNPGPAGIDWVIGRPGSGEQWFAGPRGNPTQGLASGSVMPTNGTYTWQVTLDTRASQWVIACYINGVQFGQSYTYDANPTIRGCGISQNTLTYATNVQWLSFTLTTALLPVISQPPTSQSVGLGAGYTNTVVAYADTDAGTLSYQWFNNNVALTAVSTNPTVIINPVALSDAGTNYYVVVSDLYGSVTSAPVSLTVYTNPVFVATFPVSYTNPITLFGGGNIGGTNYLGSSPTFSVSVAGAVPLTYIWLTNGVAASVVPNGGSGSSFTLTNCQMDSPTNFTCIVSNSYGQITNSWTVAYIATPTAPYPQMTLAFQPMAYWRMNQPGPGDYATASNNVICNDYQSGNNGIYTNTVLGNQGYNSTKEPSETGAYFGVSTPSYAGQMQGLNIGTPAGQNAEFTVEAWAQGLNGGSGAAILTKGVYQVNDSFALNCDRKVDHDYEFSVRTTGVAYSAEYTNTPVLVTDSTWHYLVGVCDEAHTNVSLYVDGALAASIYIPANAGMVANNDPAIIGAGSTSASAYGNIQYNGVIDDVAVYNYAFTPLQVAEHFASLGNMAPKFYPAPPSVLVTNAGATVVIPAGAIGSAPMGYYWTNVTAGVFITGGTTNGVLLNATLTINNLPAGWAGNVLRLVVTNAVGSISANVPVNALSGAPSIVTDVQTPFGAALGGTSSNSVSVINTEPFYYHWQFNGVNLTDNGRISGSQSNTLSIANTQFGDVGNYQVIISNSVGSVTSSVAALLIANNEPIGFNGTGLGWTANSTANYTTPAMINGLLTLTDGANNEARSFFFSSPLYIGAFKASFTYEATGGLGGTNMADGATFCIQNSADGAAAVGGIGGSIGVGLNGATPAIVPSVELQLHCYNNNWGGIGYGFATNGNLVTNTAPGSVQLTNEPVDVSIYYAHGQMALTLSNELSLNTFSTNLAVGDLTQVLGTNTAYVGFTGGSGGVGATQTVTNFSFVSIPMAAVQSSGANAVVSWPGSVVGYKVQTNSDLATPNWGNVPNLPGLTNNQNQIVVPKAGSKLFYRLHLP